jgi:hypothetical protein
VASSLFAKGWGGRRHPAAERVVLALQAEPAEVDVAWLAALMLRRDDDHARWEWRYARLALGVLVAERDALNDRIAQEVAQAVLGSFARDPNIAADRLDVAQGQYQARLAAYRAAMAKKDGREALDARLAREILTFAGAITGDHAGAIARAGGVLAGMMLEAAEALRTAYGTATLPDDVAPSKAGRPA